MRKVVKGSFLNLLGNILFRIGGYLYRVLLQYLLGVTGYGIVSLVLPLQNVLILIAAAGIPPAVAKYVAEYHAKNDSYMVKQVIKTSAKIMVTMSVIATLLIIFLANPIAPFLHWQPSIIILFQIIGFITPFSIILGLVRGVFQGYQDMGNLLLTRAAEQIFTIIFAVSLILLGFYVLGAVIGTIIGFAIAAVLSLLLFRERVWKDIKGAKKTLRHINEYSLAKKLLIFSLPVTVVGLAELALFDTGTYIINIFLNETYVGYYNIVSPVSRIPLVISSSIAVAMLPAASEALSLKNNHVIEKYVVYSYRYMILVLLPLCALIILFAQPILAIIFPRAPLAYNVAGGALTILVVAMAFFSIYIVSSSISQGLGKPYLPMYFLILGSIVNLILTWLLVPLYGLNGAAAATAVATLIIMSFSMWKVLEISNTELPYVNLVKITFASVLMGIIIGLIPKTIIGLLIALLVFPFIYLFLLAFTGALKKGDLTILNKIGNRLGPLSGPFMKMNKFLEKFVR